MPNDSGNNTDNNLKNEFPNQGNFSASQNNVGKNLFQSNSSNDFQVEKQKNLKDNAKKEVAKKGIEAVATAYAGPAGGQIANAVMDTKAGDKLVELTEKASRNPLLDSTKNMSKSLFEKKDDEENNEENNSIGDDKKKKKIIMFGIFSAIGCLGFLILIILIVTVMLSPIFLANSFISNVKNNVTSFFDKMALFIRGCKDEQECKEKDETSFYKKLEEVKQEYKTLWSLDIDTDLITATLTYYNPITMMSESETDDEDNNPLLSYKDIDYKKSKKQIKTLAKNMVSDGVKCIDEDNTIVAISKDKNFECPKEEGKKIKKITYKYLDEENYKKYLQDEFINKFYFDGKATEEKINAVIEDIYKRVEMVKYLNGEGNTGSSYALNSSQVQVFDNNGVQIDSVSLFEYIQGVMYSETGLYNPEEYQKAMAIVIKNYLYAKNKATKDNIPATFQIISSTTNQTYCSVKKGCHVNEAGIYMPGSDTNGEYKHPPISDKTILENLNKIINETFSEFLIDENDQFILTQYKTNCKDTVCADINDMDQQEAISMATNNNDYKTILAKFYEGKIETVISKLVLPIDSDKVYISSEFGNRVIEGDPDFHHGIDFSIAEQNNVYAVASGTVVDANLGPTTGCYIKIDHGSYQTRYLHLYPTNYSCNFDVAIGDQVVTGQKISISGGATPPTGSSTGAHLHFDYYVNGERLNPRLLFGNLLPSER